MEKKKRNKFLITGVAVLTGALLFCSGMTVGAATNEPGSAGDPIITLSYLEKRLEHAGNGYECITVKKGETLFLEQGAQVILYTGNAKVSGSLIDITEGGLAQEGTKVIKYHSYLAPADESGFTADTTCVIFLSGKTY